MCDWRLTGTPLEGESRAVASDALSSPATSNNDDLFAPGAPEIEDVEMEEEEDREEDREEEEEANEAQEDDVMSATTAALEATMIETEGETTSATDGVTEDFDTDTDAESAPGPGLNEGDEGRAPMNVDGGDAERPSAMVIEEGTASGMPWDPWPS